MPRLLRMPEVAANTTEAVLQDWSVSEGSQFRAEEAIATVETDKAVVDVEAEEAGVLLRTLVPAGSKIEVGAPIALIGDPGEEALDADAALAALGVVVGAPAVAPDRRLVPDGLAGGPPDTPSSEGPADNPSSETPADTPSSEGRGRLFVSPLARRVAREAAVDLGSVTGSGPRGRILRRDVEAALKGRGAQSSAAPANGEAAAAHGEAAPVARRPAGAEPAYTDLPHTPMRRAIAARMTESKQTVPHFYLRASVRADGLLRLRGELNDDTRPKISLNDLLVKAVGQAHLLVPEMNAVWTADAVRRFDRVDVAVAVATERGLVTPVVRDVPSLTIGALSATVRELAERARMGRLRQEELEGGTIGVTNLGMYDVEEFGAIINPPHAAILAVGAVRSEPVVAAGALAVGSVIRLTLSVDHRPVDGVVAARWLQALVSLLEHPVRILA